jgi:hypothetical protein
VKQDNRDIKSSLSFALPEEEVTFEALRFQGKRVQWNFGDGTIKHFNAGPAVHKFKRNGRYKVTVKDFDGKGKREFSKIITVGEITPNFQINILELAFNSGKYYEVASLKQPPPGYYLKLNASGRGILKGSWVLDDQGIGLFQVLLQDGKIVHLKGSDVQRLPLKDQGKHFLTLVFNNYRFNQRIPILRYFVTDNSVIQIKFPLPGEKNIKSPVVKLQWQLKDNQRDPVFEFYVSEIPPQFLADDKLPWQRAGTDMFYNLDTNKFKPGSWIYWQVRAVDRDGKVLTISEVSSFKI